MFHLQRRQRDQVERLGPGWISWASTAVRALPSSSPALWYIIYMIYMIYLLPHLVLSQQPPLIVSTSSSSLNEQNIYTFKWSMKMIKKWSMKMIKKSKIKIFWKKLKKCGKFCSCRLSVLRCFSRLVRPRGVPFICKKPVLKCQDFEIQPRLLFCQWSSSPPSARSRCTSRSRSPRTVGRTAGSTWTINFLDSSCFCKNVKDVCNRWCKDIP